MGPARGNQNELRLRRMKKSIAYTQAPIHILPSSERSERLIRQVMSSGIGIGDEDVDDFEFEEDDEEPLPQGRGAAVSELTTDELEILARWKSNNYNPDTFGCVIRDISYMRLQFEAADTSRDGHITVQEFCDFLNETQLPTSMENENGADAPQWWCQPEKRNDAARHFTTADAKAVVQRFDKVLSLTQLPLTPCRPNSQHQPRRTSVVP